MPLPLYSYNYMSAEYYPVTHSDSVNSEDVKYRIHTSGCKLMLSPNHSNSPLQVRTKICLPAHIQVYVKK